MASIAEATAIQAVAGLPPPDTALPALEPAKNREQYRERAETETEEAVWYSAEEPGTLVEPQQVRLRSIHSKQATVIVFVNKSKYRVRALWVDFKGNEVAYSMLESGSTKRYHTYVTHPWIIREVHSATRMMLSGRPAVIGLSTEQTLEIQEPPTLDWSLSHHIFFPESYKLSIRGLLLAHKALEPYATASQGLTKVISSPRKRSSDTDDASSCASPSKRMCPMPHQTRLPHMSPARGQTHKAVAAASPCSTATSSVSISSEAAHFHATLTVSSPQLANLKSTINIEMAGPARGSWSRTTLNFDTVMTDVFPAGSRDQTLPAAAPAVSSSGYLLSPPFQKPSRGLLGMFKMCAAPSTAPPRNMLKNLLSQGILPSSSKAVSFSPSRNQPAALELDVHAAGRASLKVEVQECDDMAVDDVSSAAGACWPPRDSHLGNLPSHLLVYIAELAAPVTWQSLAAAPGGRPDIKPTLMACPPITAEQQQQIEEQEQQAQQQQAQQQAGNQQ